jgi:acyl carrier protein
VKSVLTQIFHEVAPEIEFEKIDTARPLRDQAEIDSLDLYHIIVQVAQKTGVNVPDSKLADLKNIDQLVNYVSAKSAQETGHL